jgi:DNA-binding response OmpR family regulator
MSVRTPKSRNRILVVDDEFDITFTLKKRLEDQRFELDSFSGPQTALSNFRPMHTILYLLILIVTIYYYVKKFKTDSVIIDMTYKS